MSQVLDKVDATSLGEASNRYTSSDVAMTGVTQWITTFGGGATAQEAGAPAAVMSESDYRVAPRVIEYKLERTETGGFLVAEPVTGIFGFGHDLNDALRDLFVALHEHQDVLQRQESLSRGLQEQLNYLSTLL